MSEWKTISEQDPDTDPEDLEAEQELREIYGPLFTFTLRFTCNPGYNSRKGIIEEIVESLDWITYDHDGIRKIEEYVE